MAAGLAGLAAACAPEKKAATGRTAIRFATDWRAEAEHGGFYQAMATGVLIFWGFNALSRALLGRWHASERH